MSQNDPLENSTVLEAPPLKQTIDLMSELSEPVPAKPATATTPHERPFDPAFLAEFDQAPPQPPQPAPAKPAAPPEPTDPIDMVAQAIEAAGGLTEQEIQELVFASRTTANVKAFLREHEQDYHQSPENDALMNRFLVENKLVPSVENLELAMESLGDLLVSKEIAQYQQPSLPPLPKPRSRLPERKPIETGLPERRGPTPQSEADQLAELAKIAATAPDRDTAEIAIRKAFALRAKLSGQRMGSF